MTEYRLYMESGPKMRTTMVHVFELLGCVANGPTTEAALEATPGEIRQFLGFLQRHGEDVDPEAEITTAIAQHVTEGPWIGYGDPAPGFEPDFVPLNRAEMEVHLRRLGWMGDTLSGLAWRLTKEELDAAPQEGRTIRAIIHHVTEVEPEYGRTGGVGRAADARDIARAMAAGEQPLPALVEQMWRGVIARFEAATDEMLAQTIQRGAKQYTARRGLRRALEHPWEHLREIERRLEADV